MDGSSGFPTIVHPGSGPLGGPSRGSSVRSVFVGLVHDHQVGPPKPPHVPWRPFAWVAAWCWLLYLAGQVGGFAGYLVVLVAVGLGCWRLDRWLARQYWGGLRETQRF